MTAKGDLGFWRKVPDTPPVALGRGEHGFGIADACGDALHLWLRRE
jgi:hypothetical protein